jgi:hypothetical protein
VKKAQRPRRQGQPLIVLLWKCNIGTHLTTSRRHRVAHQQPLACRIICQISIHISRIHSTPTQRSHLCDLAQRELRMLHDRHTIQLHRQ